MRLTTRMVDALRVVVEHIAAKGYPPTAEEVGGAMDPPVSGARAHQLLGKLVEARKLDHDEGTSRSWRPARS